MKTTSRIYSNNSSSLLTQDLPLASTQITVENGELFPQVPSGKYYLATVATEAYVEIVRVTAVSGNVITCVRGQEGTDAASFPLGAILEVRVTASSFYDIRDDLAELNTSISSVSSDIFEG
jgi:hypothetical protein